MALTKVIGSGTGTLNSLVVADAGNIGSASDTDAIAISSGGVTTFSQIPVGAFIPEFDNWRITSNTSDTNSADITANWERNDDAIFEKIGTGFLEKNFYVDPGTTQALSDKINAEREEFRNSPVGSSTAGKVGQFTGEILPTIVIPGGIVGGVTRRMVTGAAAGGIGGIAAPTDSPEFWNEQRVVNTVVNTTLGTSGPLAISGVKYTGNKLGEITKGFRPSTVLKDVSGSVTRSDTKGAIQSATKLNTFLTPAEATGFGELVVRESSLRLDDPALQSLGVAVRGREATLKQSINDLLEEIAPNTPERATLISEGYEALARTKMTPKLLENIANDKTLGPYYTTFLKAKGYKESIADVPENSLSRLDHFNEFLNEKTKTFYKAGKNRAGKVVNDKRKELQNFVDQAVPEYAVARRVAN